MAEARAEVLTWAQRPGPRSWRCPTGPARAAFLACATSWTSGPADLPRGAPEDSPAHVGLTAASFVDEWPCNAAPNQETACHEHQAVPSASRPPSLLTVRGQAIPATIWQRHAALAGTTRSAGCRRRAWPRRRHELERPAAHNVFRPDQRANCAAELPVPRPAEQPGRPARRSSGPRRASTVRARASSAAARPRVWAHGRRGPVDRCPPARSRLRPDRSQALGDLLRRLRS